MIGIDAALPAGERVGGSAYGRIGVWEVRLLFRHGYNDQEVSTELMMLFKRRHADTPIRRYVSPGRRPIFNATLRAAASWLFFCVARSTRMIQIWALRSRLEKQPTDLRRRHHYMRDGTLAASRDPLEQKRLNFSKRDPFLLHRVSFPHCDRTVVYWSVLADRIEIDGYAKGSTGFILAPITPPDGA